MARPRLDAPNFKLVRRGSRLYVRWWQAGQWHRLSTGTEDQSEARRFLVQFAAGFAAPAPPDSPTIGQVLDGYLEERKPHVRSYATLQAAAAALKRHLGDLEVSSLTRERGRLYAKQRTSEGRMVGPADKRRRKPTSPGTIIREVVTLRAALKWAVQEKWIQVAPYVPAPSTPLPKDRWLTREEFARLFDAARAPHVRLFVALALHTGARSGALLDLQWPAVDLAARLIRLGAGQGNKGRAVVPINDDLLDELQTARKLATGPYVIQASGQATDKPVGSIKTGFRAACTRAGLEGVTPHTLRHTAATWMAIDGVPMAEISRYLGHASEAVTERVYSHHSPEYLRRAAASLTLRTNK